MYCYSYSNFRKPAFGNVQWTPVSTEGPLHLLHISGPENEKMEVSGDLGHRSFWDTLPLSEPANLNPASVKHSELWMCGQRFYN